jgi:ferrochelatase
MSPRWWSRCVRPRVAVVLFNLGGPDRPQAIRPFLLNIFTDPAILRVPFFVRPFLARRIAAARLEPARTAYAALGGRSPLLELTRAQAASLQAELTEFDAKCFIAMRYWQPFSEPTATAVRDWKPDSVVLLPLYPQHSTTTTGSSLTAWREAAARTGLVADTTVLCCYPTDAAYVAALATLLRTAWREAREQLPPPTGLRVLFSAHGLPESIVQSGDPYQWQIEQTVARVLADWGQAVDWVICYQSRATPQRWIEPSTEAEIERAAHDGVAVLVVPIAFVSDHSETLVELDIDYRALAARLGVPGYFRVPTPNSDTAFVAALADLVRRARAHGPGLCSHAGGRICPVDRGLCPLA